jgi:Secretion system C-terminal sorting domain/Subtilase family
MDLIAPGTKELISTTNSGDPAAVFTEPEFPDYCSYAQTNNQDYTCFYATSAAVPHVAGVAALLLDYHEKEHGVKLSYEDIEHVLNYGATDIINISEPIYPPSYDEKNGWGRLNAAGSLDLIDKDLGRKVYQIEILPFIDESDCEPTVPPADGCQFLSFEYPYINPESGRIYEPGNIYESEMKRYVYTLNLNLCANWPGEGISIQDLADVNKVEAWVSSSRSTSWEAPQELSSPQDLSIEPIRRIVWDSGPVFTYGTNGDLCTITGQLSGYGYRILKENSTTLNPPELIPNNGIEEENPKIIVSVLVNDPNGILPDGSVLTSLAEEQTADSYLNIYPNPGKNLFTIRYNIAGEGLVAIRLSDVNGISLRQWHFSNIQSGEQSQQIELSDLPSGVYFCQLQSGQSLITKKLLKQ